MGNETRFMTAGGVRWRGEERLRSLAERLERAVRSGEGTVVKATRVRTVVRLDAGEGCPGVLLKIYHPRGPGARLRSLVLGPSALREGRLLDHLARRGVAVPRVLLRGTAGPPRLGSRSYLALELLDGTHSLEDLLLARHALPVSRARLAAAAGRLVRALHDAGVGHGDLHGGNILVDPAGRPFLIDLHGARLHRRLSPRRRRRDLASLAPAFMVHGTRTDRFRFYLAYAAGDGSSRPPRFREEVRHLERIARERLRRVLAKMDRRPLRPGRRFQRLALYELQGMGERSARAGELLRLLGPHPEEALEERGRLIHRGGRTRVYVLEAACGTFAVKLYTGHRGGAAARSLAPGSRARRAWVNYHRLRARGLPVPDPVLYLEEPLFSASGRSLVATTFAEGHRDLRRFLLRADFRERRRVLLRLAACVARLHRLFLANRDLKAENILLSPSGKLLFVDPDGVAPIRTPSPYVMARDLMRLNASFRPPRSAVSATERRRFLHAYGRHMGLTPERERELWWEVLRLTWEKWIRWEEEGATRHGGRSL